MRLQPQVFDHLHNRATAVGANRGVGRQRDLEHSQDGTFATISGQVVGRRAASESGGPDANLLAQ
jgi:hypothetical protein